MLSSSSANFSAKMSNLPEEVVFSSLVWTFSAKDLTIFVVLDLILAGLFEAWFSRAFNLCERFWIVFLKLSFSALMLSFSLFLLSFSDLRVSKMLTTWAAALLSDRICILSSSFEGINWWLQLCFRFTIAETADISSFEKEFVTYSFVFISFSLAEVGCGCCFDILVLGFVTWFTCCHPECGNSLY